MIQLIHQISTHNQIRRKFFAEVISKRQVELAFLQSSLEQGLELITDLDKVNEILAASQRPDLVLTERVEQEFINHPYNIANWEILARICAILVFRFMKSCRWLGRTAK